MGQDAETHGAGTQPERIPGKPKAMHACRKGKKGGAATALLTAKRGDRPDRDLILQEGGHEREGKGNTTTTLVPFKGEVPRWPSRN